MCAHARTYIHKHIYIYIYIILLVLTLHELASLQAIAPLSDGAQFISGRAHKENRFELKPENSQPVRTHSSTHNCSPQETKQNERKTKKIASKIVDVPQAQRIRQHCLQLQSETSGLHGILTHWK